MANHTLIGVDRPWWRGFPTLYAAEPAAVLVVDRMYATSKPALVEAIRNGAGPDVPKKMRRAILAFCDPLLGKERMDEVLGEVSRALAT